MNIIVCLKQSPSDDLIKFDSNANIIRENIKLVNNVYDEYALENALILKDKYGFKVTAISMGPKEYEDVLRYAISKGADDAYLITDAELKGSDAFITAYVLSKFIEKITQKKDFAVFAGLKSQDAETAIVPSEISENLNIPAVLSATCVDFKDNNLIVKSELNSRMILKVSLPCCISFNISKLKKRVTSIKNKLKSKSATIPKISLKEIGISLNGFKDSPTKVIDLKEIKPPGERSFKTLDLNNMREIEKIIYE